MAKRIAHHATFKGRVPLEALKESKTLSELAQEFKLHPTQIAKWKTQAIREIAQLFEDGRKKKPSSDVDIETLYAQLGKLQSQLGHSNGLVQPVRAFPRNLEYTDSGFLSHSSRKSLAESTTRVF